MKSIEPIYDNANMTLDSIEKQVIQNRLAHYQGDKALTAKSLGITERTIYNKLDAYEKEAKISREAIAKKEASEKDWLARQRGNVPTIEKMTQADFAANPNETYGLMRSPHLPAEGMPAAASVTPPPPPVIEPVARLSTPAPAVPRRRAN
jgi:hypothetical protein